MSAKWINVDWLNHNEQRSYPLTADATALDVSRVFRLPDDFLVALNLSVHAAVDVDPAKFHLKTVGVYGSGYSVVIGYKTLSGSIPVASALIARDTHTRYAPYRLEGVGDFFDARGTLVIGRLENIDQQPAGQWEFDLEGGRLETDCLRPNIRNVVSLQVENGADVSQRIYGDVVLQAGANMRITPVLVYGEDPVLVFDAIEGEGLTAPCACASEDAQPILTINGIGPDADGNFSLAGSACLEVQEIKNGLRLQDTCSEPCCGCKELEAVTSALEQFGRQAATLENFLTSLEGRVSQMELVVLGSRIPDRGCLQCDS